MGAVSSPARAGSIDSSRFGWFTRRRRDIRQAFFTVRCNQGRNASGSRMLEV